MNLEQAREYIRQLDHQAQHRSAPFMHGRLMRWRLFGTGEPLVLIHGGHGSWLHWIRNIESLATTHTLLVPDLPGFGASDDPPDSFHSEDIAQAAVASLEALLGGRPLIDVAGFSFGGSIGARIAEKRGNVRRLALLGSAGSGTPQRPVAELVRWRPHEGEARKAALRHNLLAHMLHDPASCDALAFQAYAESTTITRYRSHGEVQRRALTDILALCHAPALFLWGEHDVTATPEETRFLERSGPQRSVKLIAGAGHWIQCEAPQAVNAALASWFSAQAAQGALQTS